ncbi:MAG: AarF/ABC1/UbiB kinase family protein [Deltaproteobacteria bacterium]|nr:AarF/ABC1/UbiB kinase family protein [Deltaproteobacteria bacterium]MBW2116521.1 AarF/ABC1/UbiB kinase family protein [Deltaproteobacteria bacterium]MBW2343262.1 AarF/ABC1/UbiB kinase family protein [Deltaproteobacteria bacterium]
MLSIRKIGVIGRTYRHLNRYRQILRVLFKYGFGDLVDILKIEQYLEIGLQMISKKRREKIEKLTRAERLRMALEELGPTFVKLGQILSTRPDLIPLEYIKELSKLQDQVPPFPYDDVRETIKSETGKFPEEIFGRFDEKPLAAASIGQVHRAILKDGEEVAVKIQRPGIRKIIEVDLEIMLHLAGLMERHLEELEAYRPTRIVEEFARSLEKETNYRTEASHIERFARQFMDDETIYIPKVFRQMSTKRILTMEYIDGIKASEVDRLQKEGYDLPEITRRGTDLIMKQIFDFGFFHADPHPGNILALPNNVIGLLDFGMVGRISRQEREAFIDLVTQVVRGDEKKGADAVLNLTYYDKDPDRIEFERDLAELIDQHLYHSLKELEIGKLLQQLLEILTKYRLRLKPDLFLMMKALSTVEGLGLMLDPDFELIKHAEPFIRRIQLRRYNPKTIAGDMVDTGAELFTLLKEIPREVRTILKQAKEGKIKIEFEHKGLEPLLFTHDRTSNRIAFAIVLAALIIGSSLITLSDIPPKWNDIPIIGLAGFIAAGIMGFWLLVTILRRGRM